jgi:predicted DNA-binding protein YlxM (UPF0122 family)
MAQCKWCESKGFFVFVNKDGLCKRCESEISFNVSQHLRVIIDSENIITKTKKLDTLISRCNVVIDKASELLKYEEKDIPTTTPKPSEVINKHKILIDTSVKEIAQEEFEKLKEENSLIDSIKTKVTKLNKFLIKLKEYKENLIEKNIINDLEETLKNLIHKTHLNGHLEEAEKFEFKGQQKKALDQYYEALYFLKKDDIDDSLQKDKINFIESKIKELGGVLKY